MDKDIKLAIIVSRFNETITDKLRSGALERCQEKGIPTQNVVLYEVAGAVEIPLVAQQLAKKNSCDAIIALGAVIRGETTHYDYVCQQVSQGCQQVSLSYELPVIFGVLTTENVEQALARVGGNKGHKGKDAVDTAIEMVQLLRHL